MRDKQTPKYVCGEATDLESQRNLPMKREQENVGLQFAKLAVNVPNAHC